MYRNYLTFQMAQSFDQICKSVNLSPAFRIRLIASSEMMLEYFGRSIECAQHDTPGVKEAERYEELKLLFVALLCLRDCREILRESGVQIFELEAKGEILQKRLEQLCLLSVPKPKIQFRKSG